VLRNALALGADQAVLLKGASEDPLAVARALAAFAQELQPALILFGNKAFGSDHGAVGAMVAELMGLPQATLINKMELGEGTFRAEREGDAGIEVVEGSLPAVFTAQKGLNTPRYASLKGIMAAKKKTIETHALAALGLAPLAQRSWEVVRLEMPPARAAGRLIDGEPEAQVKQLVELLHTEAKVL